MQSFCVCGCFWESRTYTPDTIEMRKTKLFYFPKEKRLEASKQNNLNLVLCALQNIIIIIIGDSVILLSIYVSLVYCYEDFHMANGCLGYQLLVSSLLVTNVSIPSSVVSICETIKDTLL